MTAGAARKASSVQVRTKRFTLGPIKLFLLQIFIADSVWLELYTTRSTGQCLGLKPWKATTRVQTELEAAEKSVLLSLRTMPCIFLRILRCGGSGMRLISACMGDSIHAMQEEESEEFSSFSDILYKTQFVTSYKRMWALLHVFSLRPVDQSM